jgi:putative endopeptidase
MKRRAFLSLSTTALGATLAASSGWVGSALASGTKPVLGDFGFDMAGRDLSIRPGDDFFRHGGGTWMKNNPVPSDRSRWGAFDQLAAKAESDVRAIIDELAAKASARGSIEQKIGDFYRSIMDVDAIEAAGMTPLKGDLDLIAAARTHEDIAVLFGKPDLPTPSPIGWGVGLDDGNPDRYIVTIGHGGLGLPERDFYLKDDARFKDLREKYPVHIAKMLTLAGISEPTAKAATIMALETEIAKLHWIRTDRRDSTKTYNLRKRADLETLAPDFPWRAGLGATGLNDVEDCIVSEITAMAPLATLFKNTPVESWKTYLTYHLIAASASNLTKAIDDERFEFFGKTLNGQRQQRERWKRATQAVNGALGEGIGQVYVQRHFSPTAKAKMLELVENLRKAFAIRIDGLTWMTPATKIAAKRKLATFNPKIGYPDKWRDYSALEIRPGDPIGNARRVAAFNVAQDLADLKQKTDKTRWFMTPQTVNAYYNPIFNEIVFPAAILQPPFFDENADPAINYGGIGGVIGHEMGHGFDDQGAKYDENGVLRDWWSPADVAAFNALGDKMKAQYSGFEPLPGVKLNGALGIGENIGDHCGVVVGHVAYQLSLGRRRAPVLGGLTGDQRFYLAWSQVWRSNYNEEAMRNQIVTGPHSPPEFRVNGTVQNVDGWYRAFNVRRGDKLFVAPNKRIRIW